ncbi:winged helix-turn-helix transcriptional regulator [Sphingomonas zeicaulis]|uniref:winged helix-turn-helix transcriptional regulator n=1 Tax=Sphingomonas zeicaulis TaxID=1632740 RepID=UPI003D226AC9
MGKLNEPLAALLKNCSLPLALEAMGERWSFMILRASFNGLKHFEEFQQTLGIARNILANRLGRLVDHGILVRVPMEQDRRKVEYRLTDKGAALLPALVALRQWGETYSAGTRPHAVLVDQRDRRPIQPVRVFAEDGRPLVLDDLMWIGRDELDQGDAAVRHPKAANG